jgi:Mg2+ and Co2+ transporter CorA
MYLSDKSRGKAHATSDHLEVELMLEHYLSLADELSSTAKAASSSLQSTQSMLSVVLDSQRNDLIVMDLRANLATLAISLSALVTGLFGMNLPNFYDVGGLFGAEAFVGACLVSVGVGASIFGWGLRAMARVVARREEFLKGFRRV